MKEDKFYILKLKLVIQNLGKNDLKNSLECIDPTCPVEINI